MSHVDYCRVCLSDFLPKPLLRYENMPAVAQNFPDSKTVSSDRGVDLNVQQCSKCGLVQLDNLPVHYFRDVIRAAGYSEEMGRFRRQQFSEFLKRFGLMGKKVIEIGCGRGEYLGLMKEAGADAYGIEHLPDSVKACVEAKLKVDEDFIEDAKHKLMSAPFDAFFCLNFLEHIPEINLFLRGISNNLTEDAVGLIEVPNFEMILREKMFCEFMTDHLYYFTRETLHRTLALNGFEVLECKEVWHDYILSAVVRKTKMKPIFSDEIEKIDLTEFSNYQKQLEKDFSDLMDQFPSGSVGIWGAGHQALAVMSLAKLGGGRIKYVFDSAPFKQNKFTPATHIPIVSPQKIQEDLSIKAVVVMGASYTDEIVRVLRSQYRSDLVVFAYRSNGLERV